MNFQFIPVSAYPAYTWLWNGSITKEEIKRQIDNMYAMGIRAFYIIGEPENFRPSTRRTHLSPEYLSDAYVDLVYYAFETAKEKGMYTWLYNEGGFPSGMVCGKIREKHPELAMKEWGSADFSLPAHTPYAPHERALSAFSKGQKIHPGDAFKEETLIREYRWKNCDDAHSRIRSDIAKKRNTDLFLSMTHEKLKQRFGAHMGTDVTLMFDDEAFMGQWTEGMDRLFFQRHGYDIRDYIPQLISNRFPPQTDEQCRAKSDYLMLCGDLVRENYFRPMKEWLNQNGMLSTGHLDNDNKADGAMRNRYGNALQTLREFDVPGIDVIWSQISYPENGKCCKEGYEFFPRLASSAARQQGHSRCLSESFAVYGAHVDPEAIRYSVNYQAVRGISLFNFMVISYDRKTPMAHQYRPNFIPENVGMDRLHTVNEYTARLSHLLQESRAEIHTALYFPFRTICAHGEKGQKAMESFERLGEMLEKAGVSFDLIDEDLVQHAEIKDGVLTYGSVSYRYVFVPQGDFEKPEILEKISGLSRELMPDIQRTNPFLQSRRMQFSDGSEGIFICNTAGESVQETVSISTTRHLCAVCLESGALYTPRFTREDHLIHLPLSLHRGEGIFLYLTDAPQNAPAPAQTRQAAILSDFDIQVRRVYRLHENEGILNLPGDSAPLPAALGPWDAGLSGEVSYRCTLPPLPPGKYQLHLGEVHCTALVFLNGKPMGEAVYPPYHVDLGTVRGGETLEISVANTPANECARTDYFSKKPIEDVGTYHANMVLYEAKAPAGGLFGPVALHQIIENIE